MKKQPLQTVLFFFLATMTFRVSFAESMLATEDALYMGDHEACKIIDAQSGVVRREITIPKELTDRPVWKWMSMQGDVLCGLVGNLEVQIETVRSSKPGLGHWPWGMWAGHDYHDPRTAFGYGRTLVAVSRDSGKILWHLARQEYQAENKKIWPVNFYVDEGKSHLQVTFGSTKKIVALLVSQWVIHYY